MAIYLRLPKSEAAADGVIGTAMKRRVHGHPTCTDLWPLIPPTPYIYLLVNFYVFTLCDVYVLKIRRTVTSYIMWRWCFETVMFWNFYVLWWSYSMYVYVMNLLHYETTVLRYKTLMLWKSYDMWCNVKWRFRCVMLHFVALSARL